MEEGTEESEGLVESIDLQLPQETRSDEALRGNLGPKSVIFNTKTFIIMNAKLIIFR